MIYQSDAWVKRNCTKEKKMCTLPSSKINQVDNRRFCHHLTSLIFSFLDESYGNYRVGAAKDAEKRFTR